MSSGIARRSGSGRTALWFGAPAFLGLTMFVIIPVLMSLALTFTNQRLISPGPSKVVGLENYQRLLSVKFLVQSPASNRSRENIGKTSGGLHYTRVRAITRSDPSYAGYRPVTDFRIGRDRVSVLARDPEFLESLFNTFYFAFLVVPLQCSFALGMALLVNAGLKGQALFRGIFFSPVVMSMVIVSVVWAFLFDKDLGLFNALLSFGSFGTLQPIDWLGNSSTAMPAIAIMSAWQGAGFQMLILLAGLQGIPQELYDAARIDGASAWQRFWNVTVPGLRQTIVFVLIITTIAALGLFTQVDVMTQGGPQNATSTVMFQAIQRGVREENIAYGSTISIVYFGIITVLILLQQAVQSSRVRANP